MLFACDSTILCLLDICRVFTSCWGWNFKELLRNKLRFTSGWAEVLTTEYTHRVAMDTFWRKFHHDGKISPAWWGWRVHTLQPFEFIYHHEQSCGVNFSWEGRYTPTISTLPLYVLCGSGHFSFCSNIQILNRLAWHELIFLPILCVSLIMANKWGICVVIIDGHRNCV